MRDHMDTWVLKLAVLFFLEEYSPYSQETSAVTSDLNNGVQYLCALYDNFIKCSIRMYPLFKGHLEEVYREKNQIS